MSRLSALKMIKRRARKAGLPAEICAHSFRGTGITEYLRNGGDSRFPHSLGEMGNRTREPPPSTPDGPRTATERDALCALAWRLDPQLTPQPRRVVGPVTLLRGTAVPVRCCGGAAPTRAGPTRAPRLPTRVSLTWLGCGGLVSRNAEVEPGPLPGVPVGRIGPPLVLRSAPRRGASYPAAFRRSPNLYRGDVATLMLRSFERSNQEASKVLTSETIRDVGRALPWLASEPPTESIPTGTSPEKRTELLDAHALASATDTTASTP